MSSEPVFMRQYSMLNDINEKLLIEVRVSSNQEFSFANCELIGPFLYIDYTLAKQMATQKPPLCFFIPYFFIRKHTTKKECYILEFLPTYPDINIRFYLKFSIEHSFNAWMKDFKTIRLFFANNPTFYPVVIPVTVADTEYVSIAKYTLNITPTFINFLPMGRNEASLFLHLKNNNLTDYSIYVYPPTGFVTLPYSEVRVSFVIKHKKWPTHRVIHCENQDQLQFAFISFYLLTHSIRISEQMCRSSRMVNFDIARPISITNNYLIQNPPIVYSVKECQKNCRDQNIASSPRFSSPILVPEKASTSLELILFDQMVKRRLFVFFSPSVQFYSDKSKQNSRLKMKCKSHKNAIKLTNLEKNFYYIDFSHESFSYQLKKIKKSIPLPQIKDLVSTIKIEQSHKAFNFKKSECLSTIWEQSANFPEFENAWESKGFPVQSSEDTVAPGDYLLKRIVDLSLNIPQTAKPTNESFETICAISASLLLQTVDRFKFLDKISELFKDIKEVYDCVPIAKIDDDIFHLCIIFIERLIVFGYFKLFFGIFSIHLSEFYSSYAFLRHPSFAEMFSSTIIPLSKRNWVKIINCLSISRLKELQLELHDLIAANIANTMIDIYLKGDPQEKFYLSREPLDNLLDEIIEVFQDGYISPPHVKLSQLRHSWHIFSIISPQMGKEFQTAVQDLEENGPENPKELIKECLKIGVKFHILWKLLLEAVDYGKKHNLYSDSALIMDTTRMHAFLKSIYLLSEINFHV